MGFSGFWARPEDGNETIYRNISTERLPGDFHIVELPD